MKKDNYLSTLIVSVQNRSGVLFKIAGLLRRRRFNIESLTVSHTEKADVSRFTILVRGDKQTVEKMCKQLYRIVEVLKVSDVSDEMIVARELALIKVSLEKKGSKLEIDSMVKHFRAKIVNFHPDYLVVEITGSEDKIDSFYENMKKYGILEFVRTGRTAIFK